MRHAKDKKNNKEKKEKTIEELMRGIKTCLNCDQLTLCPVKPPSGSMKRFKEWCPSWIPDRKKLSTKYNGKLKPYFGGDFIDTGMGKRLRPIEEVRRLADTLNKVVEELHKEETKEV